MQRLLTVPDENGLDDSTFSVLIVYEDFESGKAAKRTYDYLVENLGEQCDFSSQMWKFEILSIPKLRNMAVKDALEADVIMISSHGGELPACVKRWCEAWASQKTSAFALVALFDRDPEQAVAAASYLRTVAATAGIEFFAHPEALVQTAAIQTTPSMLDHRRVSKKALSTLAGVIQKDVSGTGWGLNE